MTAYPPSATARLLLGVLFALAASVAVHAAEPAADQPVDFNRQVRPILSNNCFSCHGPDDLSRKAGLRLDDRAAALKPAESGEIAVVPGQPAKSELVRRIDAAKPDEQMPPATSGKKLTPEQKEILRRWIAQGAPYQPHWAFVPPVRSPLPAVKNRLWPRVPLDYFVLSRLEQEGLSPSPEADRATLARRAALDLTGLPPTPQDAAAFAADSAPDAYERYIERLLASPAFGERWARRWLDLARYADTNGYEKDRPRSIWPYRDWVISSLNRDLPYDQFTIAQLAGDMPGEASQGNGDLAKQVATGFHRNTMINEEGGIDVEEFRFYSMIDRVNTTGAVWMGMTVGCAQCHTHKYDPLTQREYYGMFALLNNADEIDQPLPDPQVANRRSEIEKRITALAQSRAARLAEPPRDLAWQTLRPAALSASSGAKLALQDDGSILVSGLNPETDEYHLTIDLPALENVAALRLEALPHPSLGKSGPGRTPHGNFVLSELVATLNPPTAGASAAATLPSAFEFRSAKADVSQGQFEVEKAVDGDRKTGWAVDDGSGKLNAPHTAVFTLVRPRSVTAGSRLSVNLHHLHGSNHTLGCFRLSLGLERSPAPVAEKGDVLARRLAEWERQVRPTLVDWKPLRPASARSSGHATFTTADDHSVLVSGDKPNQDTYFVELAGPLDKVAAIRLEVLPHESLPNGGPGRAPLFSEGDFLLGEFSLARLPAGGAAPGTPLVLRDPTHSFAQASRSAKLTIDGDLDTGWSIQGRTGEPHHCVYHLSEPVSLAAGERLLVTLQQRYIHQMTIGRFRLSVSSDPSAAAKDIPAEVEAALLVSPEKRSAPQQALVVDQFLSHEPQLAEVNKQIADLRRSLPAFPTTLVMQERIPAEKRITHRLHRGEFLSPKEEVSPGTPSFLPPPKAGPAGNRLEFARWLASRDNPLAARVTVNRHWQAVFGRGLVRTTEDFGYQGELPSHPQLLDLMAVELMDRGWSLKDLIRQIVLSSTYRQSSAVTPLLRERDPANVLLARGPRIRLDAEMIRDSALQAAGLLTGQIGGPSVYPPQPEGVNSLAYGGSAWPTSQGADRYRRGLYTYLKRASPYPGLTTFDAPTGDACQIRRERSNTPLQALTLLNDTVFVEAARGLGQRLLREAPADPAGRAAWLFQTCLARAPAADESQALLEFYHQQLGRLSAGELSAERLLAGSAGPAGKQANELAAWTLAARAVLNLDEFVTKE